MKIYTIEQNKFADIYSIASQHDDRNIVFKKDCKYAVVLSKFYGGKGYTTHKTEAAAISKSKKEEDWYHHILDSDGNKYQVRRDYVNNCDYLANI